MLASCYIQVFSIQFEQFVGPFHTLRKIHATPFKCVKGVVKRREAHGVCAQTNGQHFGDVAIISRREIGPHSFVVTTFRSEERRVGKECRCRWWRGSRKKNR